LLALEHAAVVGVHLLQPDLHGDGGRARGLGPGRGAGRARVVVARLLGAHGVAAAADGDEGGREGGRQGQMEAGPHGWASPWTTASATARRTSRMALFSRVGWTRLVSRTTKSFRSGSIHIDVPVNPVWPNDRGPKRLPAEEFSLIVSSPGRGWNRARPRAW